MLAAYGLYWACLARTSATRVSSLIYLTPPVTTIWAFLMFGEPISQGAIAGFLLCLTGVWLARNRNRVAVTPRQRANQPECSATTVEGAHCPQGDVEAIAPALCRHKAFCSNTRPPA